MALDLQRLFFAQTSAHGVVLPGGLLKFRSNSGTRRLKGTPGITW